MWKTEGACERQRERPQETGRGRDRQTDPPSGRLTGRETPTARRGEVEEGLTGTQTDSLTLKQTNRERQTYRKTQGEATGDRQRQTDWLTLIKLTWRETHTERRGGGRGWLADRLTDWLSLSSRPTGRDRHTQKERGEAGLTDRQTDTLRQTNRERETERKGGRGRRRWQTQGD